MEAGSGPSEVGAVQTGDLMKLLSRRIVGQPTALERIVPYLRMYQTHLNVPDRPAGIFLLLGPSGTGKTRTVEVLAEVLHGSAKHLLKIDCAEYQSDHEVAKLIGAPPGYIGHRETKPLLTQERLLACVSPHSDLALVLFDEIEKASPAFTALLLGLLDRATLRLGDNTTVDFEKSFIFMTSNLGAREMLKVVRPDIGFQGVERRSAASIAERLQSLGLDAVRRRFSPEFVNRLDAVITYRPLGAEALAAILAHHIAELQTHVHTQLGARSFEIAVSPAAREFLVGHGASPESGARELKRTVHRRLTQPLAALVADGGVAPGATVVADLAADGEALSLRVEAATTPGASAAAVPVVLVVTENADLLKSLEHLFAGAGLAVLTATHAAGAREAAARHAPDAMLIDPMLPDENGLKVVEDLLHAHPKVQVVVMTGTDLSLDDAEACERHGFPVVPEPFLPEDSPGPGSFATEPILHGRRVGGPSCLSARASRGPGPWPPHTRRTRWRVRASGSARCAESPSRRSPA